MVRSTRIILMVILLSFLIKGIFLVGVFPIFKGQDESRHYNTVQYLATNKSSDYKKTVSADGKVVYDNPKQDKQDLSTYRYSEEIKEAALLTQHKQTRGTYYDKINFANSKNGIGEVEFKRWQHSRTQRNYPPDIAHSAFGKGGFSLYHWVVSKIEKLLSQKNIFIRYDVIRIISVLLGAITLLLAYKIFRLTRFSERQSLILTAIISFQPKLVTYFTNINYDVLLIPLWTWFIFVAVLVLKKGWNIWRVVMLGLILIGAIMTKPSALPLLGLVLFLIGMTFYQKLKKQKIKKISWLAIIIIMGAVVWIGYLLLKKVGIVALFSDKYLNSLGEYLNISLSRVDGSSSNYWGAMRWSVSNLTMVYVKLIWTIEWIAWFGLGLWIIGPWMKKVIDSFAKVKFLQIWKKRILTKLSHCPINISLNKCPIVTISVNTYLRIKKQLQKNSFREFKNQKKYFWFMLLAIIFLQLAIRIADWKVFTGSGNLTLGTPGRYWLPNIVPHFVLLAMGLKIVTGFFGNKKIREKYFEFSLLVFLILMILYWCYEVFDIIIPRFYL